MPPEQIGAWLTAWCDIIGAGPLRRDRVPRQDQSLDRAHLVATRILAQEYAAAAQSSEDGCARRAIGLVLALDDPRTRAEAICDVGVTLLAKACVAFTGMSRPRAAQLIGALIDFPRLAAQMSYFLEPANYAADFDRTVVSNPNARAGRPTGARDAQSCARLEGALASRLYGEGTVVKIDIANPRVLRRWVRPESGGAVCGFSTDGVHQDLGCYNGPSPLAELERGLYLVPATMLLLAT